MQPAHEFFSFPPCLNTYPKGGPPRGTHAAAASGIGADSHRAPSRQYTQRALSQIPLPFAGSRAMASQSLQASHRVQTPTSSLGLAAWRLESTHLDCRTPPPPSCVSRTAFDAPRRAFSTAAHIVASYAASRTSDANASQWEGDTRV